MPSDDVVLVIDTVGVLSKLQVSGSAQLKWPGVCIPSSNSSTLEQKRWPYGLRSGWSPNRSAYEATPDGFGAMVFEAPAFRS